MGGYIDLLKLRLHDMYQNCLKWLMNKLDNFIDKPSLPKTPSTNVPEV